MKSIIGNVGHGLDSYVGSKDSLIGIDWLNLSSSALKAAGGAAGGSSTKTPAEIEAQKKKDEEAKKAAEASASRWRLIGYGVLAVFVVGIGWLLLRKKKH